MRSDDGTSQRLGTAAAAANTSSTMVLRILLWMICVVRSSRVVLVMMMVRGRRVVVRRVVGGVDGDAGGLLLSRRSWWRSLRQSSFDCGGPLIELVDGMGERDDLSPERTELHGWLVLQFGNGHAHLTRVASPVGIELGHFSLQSSLPSLESGEPRRHAGHRVPDVVVDFLVLGRLLLIRRRVFFARDSISRSSNVAFQCASVERIAERVPKLLAQFGSHGVREVGDQRGLGTMRRRHHPAALLERPPHHPAGIVRSELGKRSLHLRLPGLRFSAKCRRENWLRIPDRTVVAVTDHVVAKRRQSRQRVRTIAQTTTGRTLAVLQRRRRHDWC